MLAIVFGINDGKVDLMTRGMVMSYVVRVTQYPMIETEEIIYIMTVHANVVSPKLFSFDPGSSAQSFLVTPC